MMARLKRRPAHLLLGSLVCALLFLALTGSALAGPTLNTPLNDSSPVTNAVSLSARAFPNGAPAAVVTTLDSYADALAAPVLAKVYGGPLLFTPASSLSANVASELARLKPTKVFLVGLPSALSSAVQAALPTLTDPSQIVVLKGADRYETAALVAQEVEAKLGSVSQVIIAPGDSFPAAVAAASLAAVKGWPLLLTPASGPFPRTSADALSALGVDSGLVVGTSLTPTDFSVIKRLMGATSANDPDGRYDLCAKVADYAADQGWLSFANVGLVPGDSFPSGLATAVYLAQSKGVLLFSKTSSLGDATAAALRSRAAQVRKVDFVGLGWPVYREVKSLNSPRVTGLSTTSGPVAGGNKVVVTGTALDSVIRVRVGKVDLSTASWKVDSATQLTIQSMPAAFGPGPAEVIVYNFWGASPANTKDIYTYAYEGPVPNGYKVVQEAIKYVGIPYLWAGESPSTGFDCSGLVKYVYSKFGISLPHYSRSQATYGTAVAKEDLLPGDLVFFYSPISHVGIYVGGGLMINAPRSGDLVTIEDAFRSSYVTARRIMSPYTRYEQTDSRLAYTGTWSTASSSSYSGGSHRYANSSGASVTVTFSGTSLRWLAKTSPVYGKAKVTVDGGAPVTVDLYSASTLYQQKVWETGNLASGTHTVRIEWTGTKNSAATDTNVSVDAFEVAGTLSPATATAPPPPPTRYEQKDARFAFAGGWTAISAEAASAGSYRRADTAGASATVTFDGTYLAWLAAVSPRCGKAKVTVDGGAPVTVDLYSASTAYQKKVWETGPLAAGPHTVKIEWTGTKNSAATESAITVDAFDISGTVTQAPLPALTRVEQTDPRLTYAGTWKSVTTSSASGGDFRYADSAGSSVTVTFVGSSLVWIGKKSPVYGKAKVVVDGKTLVTVDLYSPTTLWQAKVWETGTLTPYLHTVRIEWTGTKSSAATGTNISVDAFDVQGALN
jgi:hypothetical protein